MKEIKLLNGGVTLVDDEDYEMFSFIPWKWMKTPSCLTPYVFSSFKLKRHTINFFLHRLILNPMLHEQVDHINRNGLDNRRCNLRRCNASQNSCNKRIYSSNKSGFPGVFWSKNKRIWEVYIGVNGLRKYLGRYKSLESAILARKSAEIEFHGEFRTQ